MITREELYELVWTTPVSSLSKRLGVSGSYIAKVCGAMDVPRPDPGYWTLRSQGRAPPTPPLLPARPGTVRSWSPKTPLERTRRGLFPPVPTALFSGRTGQKKKNELHALVTIAEAQLQSAKVDGLGYLRPRMKLVADVLTSKTGMLHCLAFANELYNALEERGHRVMIAPSFERLIRPDIRPGAGNVKSHDLPSWSPFRPTIAYVGGIPLGISVIEINEVVKVHYVGGGVFVRDSEFRSGRYVGHTWLENRPLPSGRLKLTVYSPFPQFPMTLEWLEEGKGRLGERLDAVVAALEANAVSMALRLAAGHYHYPGA